jgi:hypothetical protein
LFDFDEIRWSALLVDPATQVASSSVVARSSCQQQQRDLVALVLKVFKVDPAVHNGKDPLFAFYDLIEIPDHKIVPHHLVLPRLVLLNRAGVAPREKVMSINICIVVSACVDGGVHLLIIFASQAHHIFLETARQVICIRKVESLVDLDLLKILDISVFLVAILRGRRIKEWD